MMRICYLVRLFPADMILSCELLNHFIDNDFLVRIISSLRVCHIIRKLDLSQDAARNTSRPCDLRVHAFKDNGGAAVPCRKEHKE